MDLRVRLIPRASRDEIAGTRDGVLLVRVTAPPVGGRANAALCRLVAKQIGVAAGRVTVLRGLTARDKTLRLDDIADEKAVLRALGLDPPSGPRAPGG